MKHIFIINPTAGKKDVTKEITEKIERIFKARQDEYEIVVTEYQNHAVQIVKERSETEDVVRVYAVGGDGTFLEVVSGAYGLDNCQVAVVPCGTGNDFAKSLALRYNYSEDLEDIINGDVIDCDLIDVGGRISANIASVGFDGSVAKNVTKFKRIATGNLAYMISLLYCFITKTKYRLKIVIDDKETFEGDYLFAVAANGGYYGGGFFPAPEFSLSDGLLDFVLVKAISRISILKLMNKYKTGEHIHWDIVNYVKGKKIVVESKSEAYCNCDGEITDLKEPVTMKIIPSALKLVISRENGCIDSYKTKNQEINAKIGQ